MSRAAGQGRTPHGVLVLDKPTGPTSHDVVGAVRRIFGTRRVGHAGTLDPLASGVLVVLLGEATKLSAVLTRESKEYEAVVALGEATESLDAQGRVTRKKTLTPGWLESSRLSQALEAELYRELQVPPAVSAIKVGGQRAYALTRDGKPPDLEPRQVHVEALSLLDWNDTRIHVRLRVSKGYYVRAFARDLGDSLGVPSHLASLRRLASGAFGLDVAVPFPPTADSPLLTVATAVRRSLSSLEVTELGALKLRQGKLLGPEDWVGPVQAPSGSSHDAEATVPLAAFRAGELLGLVEPSEIDNHFKVKRGFVAGAEPASDGPDLHPEQGGG